MRGASVGSVLATSTANDGTYSWTISASQAIGTTYKIRISDAATGSPSDLSDDYFDISSTGGPRVGGITLVPATIRAGQDLSATFYAVADETLAGGETIALAEYWTGVDPGRGSGTALTAMDGAFDESIEGLTATVDTSAWAVGTVTLSARAQDSGGSWGNISILRVTVSNPSGPSAIADLAAEPVEGLVAFAATVSDASAEQAGYVAGNLVDSDTATLYRTLGSVIPQEETFTLDLGSVVSVGAVRLVAGPATALFPAQVTVEISDAGVVFTPVAWAAGLSAAGGPVTIQFEAADAQYVRVTTEGRFDLRQRVYRVELSGAEALSGGTEPKAVVTFTTPEPTVTALSSYDLRASARTITESAFASATEIAGLAAPVAAGTPVTETVALPNTTGMLYLAIKTSDTGGMWSDASNVAEVEAGAAGFAPLAPGDAAAGSVEVPDTFEFAIDPDIKSAAIEFSNAVSFPPGTGAERTVRFAVAADATSFAPSAAQWKLVKALTDGGGTVYWRLRGRLTPTGTLIGPARSLLFDGGQIDDLALTQGDGAPSDTVTPVAALAPRFVWTDNTSGLTAFFVDVSTDAGMPLADRRRTITFAGRGTSTESLQLTAREWLKARKLAATTADGVLNWRVRAQDRDKTIITSSAVTTLTVDGGAWTLSDLDLSAISPSVVWTNDSEGITQFSIEFSPTDEFLPRQTLRLPSRPIPGVSLTIDEAALRRLQLLAARNSAASLFYRVRGEDADRAFKSWSDANEAAMP